VAATITMADEDEDEDAATITAKTITAKLVQPNRLSLVALTMIKQAVTTVIEETRTEMVLGTDVTGAVMEAAADVDDYRSSDRISISYLHLLQRYFPGEYDGYQPFTQAYAS